MAKNKGLTVTEDALEKIHGICEGACGCSDFGNGRYVRNVLETGKMNQATRLLNLDFDSLTAMELTTIRAEDIEAPIMSHESPRGQAYRLCRLMYHLCTIKNGMYIVTTIVTTTRWKEEVMYMKELSTYFAKVIGYSAIKSELFEIADALRNTEVYRKLGVKPSNGVLLHGEPGVGKTLMASALIEASGRAVYTCRKDKPNGEFVREIKETFDSAAENAPSIVFLDDLDKFTNGDPRRRDAEEYVTVQSCIDECKAKGADVFVLATANAVEHLPHSLLRAGRFDRVIEVETPTGKDAEAIVAHYIADKNFDDSVDPKVVAQLMDGHSCAQLEMCINAAGLLAGYERCEKITMAHFTEAVLRTLFDVPAECNGDDEDDEFFYADRIANGHGRQVCYHEAGHAVVSEILCPGSVTLVSAHRRSGKSGGFTAYRQDPDMTGLQWRISRVIASLGGMAAVEQQFGVLDSGCSKDLNQAHSLLYSMVQHEGICGFSLHESPRRDSEELLHATEQAAAAETEKCFRKAKEILSLNRAYLDAVAAELAEKKLLTSGDMQRIKAACTIVPVAA